MDISRRFLIGATGAAGIAAGSATAASRTAGALGVSSPDKRTRVTLDTDAPVPTWSVTRGEKILLLPSELGLWLSEGRLLGAGAKRLGQSVEAVPGRFTPLFGQSAQYDDPSNELTVHFRDTKGISFDLIIRVFDGAVALRYRLVGLPAGRKALRIMGERTNFRFQPGARLYAGRDEGDLHLSTQAGLAPLGHPDPTSSSDSGPLADLPVTVDTGDGLFACLAESDRLHYPRMMVTPGKSGGLVSHLMRFPARATGWGGEDNTPPEPDFEMDLGQSTPWRVLLIGDSARALIERHAIVPLLASENRLGDTSWIKPGQVFRIMPPYTTDTSLRAVDFAEKHKIEYVMFDAHWYGDGTDASAPTAPIAGLDLQRVIDYGKSRNIGIILYIDRVAVTRALDDMCRLYQQWGVAGVKLGFMWEGRQSDVDFIYKIVKAFGDHRMVVNLHDDLRPAGLERTLPNYLTMEGVKGNEQFPPARHNVNLAFTRMIVGPADYTICYAQDRNQTTKAHQLALAVTCYSPLTSVYWYDKAEKYDTGDWPELKWFDDCPTTWDETRAIAGELGEYVIIARRKGSRWYLGAITNEMERRVDLPLDFLGAGSWKATRYTDGTLTRPAWKTPVSIASEPVTSTSKLHLQLNAAGGQAILFDPS
jgi:alpha-glucosidase